MDVVERVAQLRGLRVPHAVATVVHARKPSSGKPGDRAIITADRRVEGWVGGACAESVVVAECVASIEAGTPRYVVLDAEATEVTSSEDRITHPLSCHSGGAIELFIEPFAPPLVVAVVGDSPVARMLADLCTAAGFEVATAKSVADYAPVEGAFVAVATMGKGDELAARSALSAGAPYVAVVASRRRAAALRAWLVDHDVDQEQLAALHAPAGLDLGARGHEAIAISILAEIATERGRLGAHGSVAPLDPAAAQATDPVCGMIVDLTSALTAEHDGRIVGFCNPGCREAFLADPERFVDAGFEDGGAGTT